MIRRLWHLHPTPPKKTLSNYNLEPISAKRGYYMKRSHFRVEKDFRWCSPRIGTIAFYFPFWQDRWSDKPVRSRNHDDAVSKRDEVEVRLVYDESEGGDVSMRRGKRYNAKWAGDLMG